MAKKNVKNDSSCFKMSFSTYTDKRFFTKRSFLCFHNKYSNLKTYPKNPSVFSSINWKSPGDGLEGRFELQ